MTNLRSILLGSAAAMTLAVGPVFAQTPEPAETVTEEVGEAGQVVVQGAEEVGEAGANVVAEGAAEVEEGVAQSEIAEGRWAETYGETYGEFGDRNVEELVGTDVLSAEGNNIGEVDNFVLMGEELAAVVGIGGFLGIGEHRVALALSELTWDGEQLVVAGYTEDQLREIPAYDEAGGTVIGAGTLREGFNAGGQAMAPAEPAAEGEAADMAATSVPAEGEAAEGESAELQAVEEEIAEEADEVQNAEAGEATNLTEQAQQETAGAEAEPVEGAPETAEAAPADAAPDAGANLTEQAGGAGSVPLEGAGAETAEATTPPAEGEAEMTAEATTPPAEGEAEMAAEATTPPAEGEAEMTAEATTPPAEGEAEVTAEATTPPAEGEAEMTAEATTPPAEGEAEMTAEATTPPAEGEAETAEVTTVPAEATTETAGDRWTDDMNNVFGDIADLQVAELIGTDVAGADGEVVGQVDNFALTGEQVVAVVGVGGFLGLGEHNVGLPLDQLTWDGERLVLSGMTEEDLRNMPAYDEAGGAFIEGENTLRGTYEQM